MMADKTTTIRLQYKADVSGTKEAQSEIDRLNKAITKQEIQLRRIMEKSSLSGAEGHDQKKNQEAAAKRLLALQGMIRFEKEVQLQNERSATQAALALKRTKELADLRANIQARFKEKDSPDNPANQISQANARTNAANRAREEADRAKELAGLKANIQARSAAQAESQKIRDKEIARIRAAQAQIEQEEQKSGERILAAKRAREEQAAEDAERYGKIRRAAANDEAANALKVSANSLEQRAADDLAFTEFLTKEEVRRSAITKALMGGGAVAGGSAGGAGSTAGALSGFGGKMVLGRAAGMAAGDILGDQHGGKEIGSAVSAFMFGGPAIGAAVVGMEAIGTVVKAQRDASAEADKAASAYAETLNQLSSTWASLSTEVIESTPFGKKMESELDRASSAVVKLGAELAAFKVKGPSVGEQLWTFGSIVTGHGVPTNLGYQASERMQTAQIDAEERQAMRSRVYSDREYPKHVQDQARLNALKADGYKLDGMQPGILKQEAQAANEAAVSRMKLENTHREQSDQADIGLANARAEESAVGRLYTTAVAKNSPYTIAEAKQLELQLRVASDRTRDAKKAVGRLPGQQASETKDLEADISGKQAAQAVAAGEKIEAEQQRVAEANVRATKDGWAKEDALRKIHNDKALADAAKDGPLNVTLVKQEQTNEEAAITKERGEEEANQARKTREAVNRENLVGYAAQLANQKLEFQHEEDEADKHGQRMAKEAEHAAILAEQNKRQAEKRDAALAPYDTDAAVRTREHQEEEMKAEGYTAEQIKQLEIGRYINDEEERRITLLEKQGKLTMEQAEIAKWSITHKGASDDEKAAEAKAAHEHQIDAEREDAEKYGKQTAMDKLALAEKQGKVSRRDAEIGRAIMADPLAQQKNAAGEKLRKDIVAMVDAKEALEGGKMPMRAESSTKYIGGHINFRALAGGISGGGQHEKTGVDRTNKILEDVRKTLEAIHSDSGGIN